MVYFNQVKDLIKIDSSKRVAEIEVTLEVKNAKGHINITDVMLQGGPLSTIWVGHPSEMRWQHDW